MAVITFKGDIVNTSGELPSIGTIAPKFTLVKNDLSSFSLDDLKGKKVVLNIFPSIDTGVCAMSVRQFNAKAVNLKNTVVVCISRDLPFAHKRFCGAEGIENVISASEYKDDNFSKAYGVKMINGHLEGLLSRSVVVIDENSIVKYTEQVPEITQEPNYDAALSAL
jgi:thioredoxin-dependent peroxiredoxin